MPRLSFFYGIAIYLYYEDHPPPHIHARYSGHNAKVSIVSGEVIEGSLPRRASRLVAEWVSEHADEPEAGTIVWPNGADLAPDVLYDGRRSSRMESEARAN